MKITREVLGKIPSKVLLALYKNSAEGELENIFEEEILDRIKEERHLVPSAKKAGKPRKKRVLSAAGRKAISEASKRRWARVKVEREAPAKIVAKKKK